MSLLSTNGVKTLARYNTWQNSGLRDMLQAMDAAELTLDRGAFFGSIFATANHLLWGDMIWMSRFDGKEGPPAAPGDVPRSGITASVGLTETIADWAALRATTDQRIRAWADGLSDADLEANLTWYSGAAGREISKPIALCIMGFFNHQTHHRGQIHAMLTAAGKRPNDTDLFLMPQDV